MNDVKIVKLNESRAAEALKALFHAIPGLEIISENKINAIGPDEGHDIVFEVSHNNKPHQLIVEVKNNGQPRRIREAIWRLRDYTRNSNRDFVSIIATDYLSPKSRDMCKDANIGYLDMMGNAHLTFGSIYIEKTVAETPKAEARALRSLFTPKAARVLSVMMAEPWREWRVTELAEAADVSLGHVSNIRKRLLLREWAEEREHGICLKSPGELLDVWRERHPRLITKTVKGYTHLHGSELTERLRGVLSPGHHDYPLAICAGATAAQWIAPYERSSRQSFYADEEGMSALVEALDISDTSKGGNVSIQLVSKDKILPGIYTATEGIFCTSWLQTYLDLWKSNERSREAADVLREACFEW